MMEEFAATDDRQIVKGRAWLVFSKLLMSFLNSRRTSLESGRKTAFYFEDFVSANPSQYQQVGTKYENSQCFE